MSRLNCVWNSFLSDDLPKVILIKTGILGGQGSPSPISRPENQSRDSRESLWSKGCGKTHHPDCRHVEANGALGQGQP